MSLIPPASASATSSAGSSILSSVGFTLTSGLSLVFPEKETKKIKIGHIIQFMIN